MVENKFLSGDWVVYQEKDKLHSCYVVGYEEYNRMLVMGTPNNKDDEFIVDPNACFLLYYKYMNDTMLGENKR